ncbi:hypothetical protein D3C71_20580 [compost metagenome]
MSSADNPSASFADYSEAEAVPDVATPEGCLALSAARSRLEELGGRYRALREQSREIRAERARVFDELRRLNTRVAAARSRLGPASLEFPYSSEEEVLYTLVQLAKERFDALSKQEAEPRNCDGRHAPTRHRPSPRELFAETLLRGPTAFEVADRILRSRGLSEFAFTPKSVQKFNASVHGLLQALETAGRVRRVESTMPPATWMLIAFAGAEVVDSRFVAAFAQAQVDLAQATAVARRGLRKDK